MLAGRYANTGVTRTDTVRRPGIGSTAKEGVAQLEVQGIDAFAEPAARGR